MLKTGMYNKLEEMKNGGYTLFSDKTRKVLLAMGLSLLSVGTLSQVASAEMAGDVTHKKTAELEEGKIRYQITLTETDTNYALEGIYDAAGTTLITPLVGNVAGNESTVVIEVDDTETEIMIKNTNADEQTITLEDGEVLEDNNGPAVDTKTLIKYITEDGKYLQVRFTDDTKIYKIEDQDGHQRVLLKEKERDTDVTVKYILEDDDESFIVYDILGNSTEVRLSDAQIDTTFNARNLEGTVAAIKVTRTIEEGDKTYELTGLTTGAGEEITFQDADNDIYEDIPAGTTRVILTYTETNPIDPNNPETKTVVLPLILDKTGPSTVAYQTAEILNDEGEVEGYTVEESKTGSARAYFNREQGKGIVEVKDIQSGITKIVTLKGEEGNYVEEAVVYNVTDLSRTVLWLFNVTNNTTAVRVYDGVGDIVDIPLVTDENGEGTTVTKIKKEENGSYTLIAQDVQAGLGRIRRDGADIANFTSSTGFTIPDTEVYVGEEQGFAGDEYDQYTLKRFEMTVTDKGNPIIYVYDALGNISSVSFDEFAFACHYATYNEADSLAISVTETRGIWKVVTTICDKDAAEEPAKPTTPQPAVTPVRPSIEKPVIAPTEPTTPIPPAEDLVTPPTETAQLAQWNEWINQDTQVGPSQGEQYYALWSRYLLYKEQQATIQEWANYEAQQELITLWEQYDLWEQWQTWNEWRDTYKHTYTLEVFAQDNEPEELTKTYQVPEGIVEEVRIYNTNGDVKYYTVIRDQLINIAEVTDEDRITTAQNLLAQEDGEIIGATLNAKYGIKRITYSDGCVVQFYDELPTELFVNCKVLDAEGEPTITTVTAMDAIGNTATITTTEVTCSYNDEEPYKVVSLT